MSQRRIVAASVAVAVASAIGAANAYVARLEILAISWVTLGDEQSLTDEKDGKPFALGAELPPPGRWRLPAVVLLHGSSGNGGSVVAWAQYFNDMGGATLVVDSLTARGIGSTVADQAQLGRLSMIVNA